jgi:hypothetical protein
MIHKQKKKETEQLNQVQELFLELAGCFIHDEKAHLREVPSSLENLANLAGVHKLSPAIFEVLRLSCAKEAFVECEFWSGWRGSAIREIIFQGQRADGFLAVYRQLLEAGVKPLVVKGMACRSLYTKPDYRTSSDEDMLVRKEDVAVCDKILLEQGFYRGKLDFENLPHEIAYRNPVNGVYIELHFSLFDAGSDVFGGLNEVFTDAFESARAVKVQGVDVWTLNPTAHFLYLLCHCYKHFLYSGFGIRQVCDMVIMAEKWGHDMDWPYLQEQIEAFRMERFFRGLLNIGYGWLHMPAQVYGQAGLNAAESLEEAREASLDLLQDILDAGIYGSSTRERLHSANITLAAAEKESGLLRSLFPGMDYMKSRYPFMEKHPVLLPAAWVVRMSNYVWKGGRKSLLSKQEESVMAESGNSLDIGRKRVELIRKYGLME